MFRAHSPHPPPIAKSKRAREDAKAGGGRTSSRVLARLASAAQIGELARRPISRYHFEKPVFQRKRKTTVLQSLVRNI